MSEVFLPNGWVMTTFGEVADGNVDRSGATDSEFIYVDISSVDREKKCIADVNVIQLAEAPSRAKQVLQSGDVLVSMTRPNLNAIAIVSSEFDGAIGSTGFHVLRSRCAEPKFLFLLVQTRRFIEEMSLCVQGALYPAVRPKDIALFGFPFPPFNEQHRIVAKIEELFSELDKGIENLKTARTQLKVYRQALLKHAFEGKLTAQWRAENRDKLESADTLLKRIQQERAQRYQQQLTDWEASDKQGSKPKAPKYMPSLTAKELAELPELPEGWVYAYLSDLGNLGRGKSKHRPRNDPRLFGGIFPFVQTGEVKAANRIIRQYSQTLSAFGLQQSKLWPSGTLCITIAANIAETAFLGFDGCFPDSVVGFSAFKKIIAPEYVDFFIQAARTRIEAYAPATAQKNINLETLENLVVPYCCTLEQMLILDVLEKKFSIIDQLDQTITISLQQAEALRQSILKKAFSGQLVLQDPNDEPASELLAHIKAEKAAQSNNKKRPHMNTTASIDSEVWKVY